MPFLILLAILSYFTISKQFSYDTNNATTHPHAEPKTTWHGESILLPNKIAPVHTLHIEHSQSIIQGGEATQSRFV